MRISTFKSKGACSWIRCQRKLTYRLVQHPGLIPEEFALEVSATCCMWMIKLMPVKWSSIILSYCGWWLLHEQPTLQQNRVRGSSEHKVRLGHDKRKKDCVKITASSNTNCRYKEINFNTFGKCNQQSSNRNTELLWEYLSLNLCTAVIHHPPALTHRQLGQPPHTNEPVPGLHFPPCCIKTSKPFPSVLKAESFPFLAGRWILQSDHLPARLGKILAANQFRDLLYHLSCVLLWHVFASEMYYTVVALTFWIKQNLFLKMRPSQHLNCYAGDTELYLFIYYL